MVDRPAKTVQLTRPRTDGNQVEPIWEAHTADCMDRFTTSPARDHMVV